MKQKVLAVITQALRENPERAERWGMALVNKQLQQEQDAGKLRRIIEFKTKWRHLCEVAKEAKE